MRPTFIVSGYFRTKYSTGKDNIENRGDQASCSLCGGAKKRKRDDQGTKLMMTVRMVYRVRHLRRRLYHFFTAINFISVSSTPTVSMSLETSSRLAY